MRRTRLAAFAIALASTACGSTGTSLEAGVFRAPGGVAFRVGDVSPEWHRVDTGEAALAYRDDHGESLLVDGRCNLRGDDIPLVALTNQLIMGTTDRNYVMEETIPFDRREARHTVMRAKLDGVLMVWDLYVMKKDACVYDVVYVAPPDRFDGGRAAFERFAGEFHTVESPS
jgi:hypothetical protein